MSRTVERDRIKDWQTRVDTANRAYKAWEEEYQCDRLEDYYYGHQWDDELDERGQKKYTVNLIWPTVNIKIPSLFFNYPRVKLEPKPTRTDDPKTQIEERAKLQADAVNTKWSDPEVGFKLESQLALKEAFWRFGVLEVGYTADFIDNPLADKPMLKEDTGEPFITSRGDKVIHPKVLINREDLYIKRVPARNFRVGINARNDLNKSDWCGYFEYHHPEDIRRNKNYRNTAKFKNSASIKTELTVSDLGSKDSDREARQGLVKLWKIWDIRTGRRHVFADGEEKFFMEGRKYKYLPFATLKFYEVMDEWYPVPPLFNLASVQDELNETREMQRVHRKRFYRRYLINEGAVEEKEIEKLETGGDGVYAKVAGDPSRAIAAVPDAPLDPAIARNLPATKEDFREISGEGGEQRGVREVETATQANIIEVGSQIRSNFDRQTVADWMSLIGRLTLITLRLRMTKKFWIKVHVDPQAPLAALEALEVEAIWRQIKQQDLGDINMEVTIDVDSLSPLGEAQKREQFFQGLTVVSNPAFGPLLTFSPVLLKKALSFFGITSDRDISGIRDAMALNIQMQAMLAAQAKGGGSAGVLPPGPGPTPGNGQIADQIGRQLPLPIQ